MSDSFDIDDPDRFVCGTVGEPGARVFYLQAVVGQSAVTLKLEKQQIALLADYLDRLLTGQELPDGPDATFGELMEPIEPAWIVGSMMVAINESTGKVVVIAQELDPTGPDGPDLPDEDLDDAIEELLRQEEAGVGMGAEQPDLAELRVALTRNQVEAFIASARDAVSGGRPACRLCGQPMNVDGHNCPRWN